ncbi:receptor protein [Trifolium repens]|nr:receptor protein [Trifolium repens]
MTSSMIPQELHKLQNLRYLNLSNARFEGHVPKEISQLTRIISIDGVAISTSIAEWGRALSSMEGLRVLNFPPLASLRYLNLANTNFSGPLPNTISNLKQLSTIDLSYCQFNETIPSSMSKLTQLVYLEPHSIDLGFNSFNGGIPSSLLKLPYLRELKLPFNQLSGLVGRFDSAYSPVLEMLDLGVNNLQGQIPMSVFNLRTLRVIQLSSNNFTGTIQLDIIRRLSNLTILGLSHNNLSVSDNFKDDHDLSPFPEIKTFMLSSCKLREIPSFLRNQSTLLSLDLSGNDIEGPIPNWIWQLESLISLNLSKNFLTHFEETIWNLSSNLYVVDLSFNQLRGAISFIPKYASYLDYSNNRLSSTIPSDIGNYLPFMRILFLSNNNFKGRIHESFCNASTLRLLDLSYNSFDGTIPKCFAALSSNLRMLNFGGNKLRGTIPKSLVNCKKLQVLNLGNNALIDKFPCFLSNISTLRIIFLRSNELHGSIGCPHSDGDWKMLHIVDLATKNLTGTIPGTLLNSWKAMMRDEGMLGPEFGHLFFEIDDNYQPMSLKDVLPHLNKYLALKLVKLLSSMPRSILQQGLVDTNFAGLDLSRYQDSIIIVNKGLQMKCPLVKLRPMIKRK